MEFSKSILNRMGLEQLEKGAPVTTKPGGGPVQVHYGSKPETREGEYRTSFNPKKGEVTHKKMGEGKEKVAERKVAISDIPSEEAAHKKHLKNVASSLSKKASKKKPEEAEGGESGEAEKAETFDLYKACDAILEKAYPADLAKKKREERDHTDAMHKPEEAEKARETAKAREDEKKEKSVFVVTHDALTVSRLLKGHPQAELIFGEIKKAHKHGGEKHKDSQTQERAEWYEDLEGEKKEHAKKSEGQFDIEEARKDDEDTIGGEGKATHPRGTDSISKKKSVDDYTVDFLLEKGRKAAWQKEGKDEGDKEAMMPGRIMGDPGSREHMNKRIGKIHEEGRSENLKRMASSSDPADRKYAEKHGVKAD